MTSRGKIFKYFRGCYIHKQGTIYIFFIYMQFPILCILLTNPRMVSTLYTTSEKTINSDLAWQYFCPSIDRNHKHQNERTYAFTRKMLFVCHSKMYEKASDLFNKHCACFGTSLTYGPDPLMLSFLVLHSQKSKYIGNIIKTLYHNNDTFDKFLL